MALHVTRQYLIESLAWRSDEGTSSLNTATGDVISVPHEAWRDAEHDEPLADFPAWQHEALPIAKDILAIEPDFTLPHYGTLVSLDRGS